MGLLTLVLLFIACKSGFYSPPSYSNQSQVYLPVYQPIYDNLLHGIAIDRFCRA